MTTTRTTPISSRTLHLVDLENLCGDPCAPGAVARAVLDEYLHVAGWRPGDHVRIAANGGLLADALAQT